MIPYGQGDALTEEFLWKDEQLIVQPFAEVRLAFGAPVSDPPHTEDWEIDPRVSPQLLRVLPLKERKDFLTAHLDPSVNSIFGAQVQDERYICKGDGDRSLGTVLAKEVLQVTYGQKRYEGEKAKWEHRISFEDEAGARFDLAITDLTFRTGCEQLREAKGWSPRAIADWFTEFLASPKRTVYLRIGLARGWEKYPDRCYLQVTGVYSFPDYLGGKTLADFR